LYPPLKILDLSLDIVHFIIEASRSLHGGVFHDLVLADSKVEEALVVKAPHVDVLNIFFVEPFDSFSVFPKTILDLIFFRNKVCSEAMLFSFPPVAFIAPAVCPGVDAKPVFLIVFVLAFIAAAIVPDVESLAFHIVVDPLSFILATV
jgi:hypothetical protein